MISLITNQLYFLSEGMQYIIHLASLRPFEGMYIFRKTNAFESLKKYIREIVQ